MKDAPLLGSVPHVDGQLKSPTKSSLMVATLVMLVVVVGLWFLVGSLIPRWRAGGETAVLGQWGDKFGAVNALFSGLAFGGVVIALWFQHRETTFAIEQQRQAALQHSAVVRTQIVLDVLDDIRSQEWGAAHAELWKWQREHGERSVDAFLKARGATPHDSRIDVERRTFLKPVHKVWALSRLGVIDDTIAKEILSIDIGETMSDIILPFECSIRGSRDRVGVERLAEFIHRLYPQFCRPSDR